jgi:hypothetical protein
MRLVWVCAFASLLLPVADSAEPLTHRLHPSPLTVILDFDGPHSDSSIQEMKREIASILKSSGIRFDWRMRGELGEHDTFTDLVLVKFKGKCVMDPMPMLYDERGPLASTYSTDGVVLPFSEVACDKVRVSIRSAMWGEQFARADTLFGRALGRILAHELYHIVAATHRHGKDGVAKSSLSGGQLIAEHLEMNERDLYKMAPRR